MAGELAKVLWFYNLLSNTSDLDQKIVCPFHSDVNPSMKVNLADNSWYCFGCNKFGDDKRFVKLMEKKYHNLNDLQAYKKYLKILNSNKVSDIKIKPGQVRHRRSSKELYDMAYDDYHGLSKVDWRAPSEITEISDSLSYMEKRGFSAKTLNKVKAKVTYEKNYPIVFPLTDNGKFRGWVKRTTDPEVEAKRKYLYNKGFSRATTVCGDYGSERYVIVVEGYMDRLKFIQYGIDNVVAILGWKMSKQQEEKLKAKGIIHIISALDNDACGKKGTMYLKTIFDVIRFCYLKGIKDPGEMSKEQFNKCYSRTMSKYQQERNKRQ